MNLNHKTLLFPHGEKQIAQMFNRISKKYDFLNGLLSLNQDKRWRRILVQSIPTSEGGVFVDVATGTGDVLIALAKQKKGYKKYVGVDIASEMLDLAKEKAKRDQLNHLKFEIQSAHELKLSDQSVEALSISFGLRNVIIKDKALKEFYRVMKPKGRVLILDFFIPKKGLWAFLFQFYFHKVLPKIAGLFSDKSAYQYLPESVNNFYSPRELVDKMNNLGFHLESRKPFIFGWCQLLTFQKEK